MPQLFGPNGRVKTVLLAALLLVIVLGLYPVGRHVWASWHYRQALAAIEQRDFAAARPHLDLCIREWPDSGETRFLAARTARRAGELDAAERLVRDAERLGWVENALTLERALLAVQRGDLYPVLGYLLSCLHRDHPDSELIVEVLTPAALSAFDLGAASECAQLWAKLDPASPMPHIFQGDVAERMRQRNEAVTQYKEAVRLGPDNVDARLRCGRLLLETNAAADALPHFDWLAKRIPDDPDVQLGLARCLHDLGRDGEALPVLEKLQAAHPDRDGAAALRGLIALDGGRPAEAEPLLRRALAKNPGSLDLLHNLARCLDQLSKTQEAEELRKRGIAAARDQEETAKFAREVSQRPQDPAPRCEVAIRLMRNGLEVEAKRWLESALRLNERYVPALTAMADYYERIGELTTATAYRKMATEAVKKN